MRAPAPVAVARARTYSVHREFGYAPDPVPQPAPRAVTLAAPEPEEIVAPDLASEDMAEPEGPLPPRDRNGRRTAPSDRLLGSEVD